MLLKTFSCSIDFAMYKHVTLNQFGFNGVQICNTWLITMAQHRFGVIFVEQKNLIWAVIINPCNYSSIKKGKVMDAR